MSRRQYSEDEKASALAFLTANRGNVDRTARQTKVPRGTLRRWVRSSAEPAGSRDRAVAHLRHEKIEDLVKAIDVKLALLLTAVDEDRIEEAGLTQITTAFGTLVDKKVQLIAVSAQWVPAEQVMAIQQEIAAIIADVVTDEETREIIISRLGRLGQESGLCAPDPGPAAAGV